MSHKPPIPDSKPKPAPAPEPAAADALDAAVHQILRKLKEGKPVRLPGLGTLRPGPEKSLQFDQLTKTSGKETARGGKKPSRG